MTQFLANVKLDDSEIEVLERALQHYVEVCRQEIKKGGGLPFETHRRTIQRLRALNRTHLKKRGMLCIDYFKMGAVGPALQSYLQSCEQTRGKHKNMREKRIIKKLHTTLNRAVDEAIIRGSISLAMRSKSR